MFILPKAKRFLYFETVESEKYSNIPDIKIKPARNFKYFLWIKNIKQRNIMIKPSMWLFLADKIIKLKAIIRLEDKINFIFHEYESRNKIIGLAESSIKSVPAGRGLSENRTIAS